MLYASAAGFLVLMAAAYPRSKNAASASGQPDGNPRPVVVELFTSEGCSSCPPADALLKRMSEQQPVEGVQIIALEEHVDYWNHLGWADPFSSDAFSRRQDEYARTFGNDGVYTPQIVVDGQFELVGSRGAEARETIQKAASLPKLEVKVNAGPNSGTEKATVEIQIRNPLGLKLHDAPELWAAVTETNLQSNVKAGENSGELLRHAAVVRSLRKVDTLKDPSGYQHNVEFPLDSKWKKENLSIVVFVTEKNSRKIIGAGAAALHP